MATAQYLQMHRSGRGTLAVVAHIRLPRADGTQIDNLYVSQTEVGTPANSATGDPARVWQSMVRDYRPVHAPGGFGSTDLPLCTGGMNLYADRTVVFPAGIGAKLTTTIRASLATHVWTSARVTIWRYFTELGDFQHAQIVLKDAAVNRWNIEDDGTLHIAIRQATDWNLPLMPRVISRSEFPRATDSVVGMALPVVYGNLAASKMRRPWPFDPVTGHPTNHRYYRILNSSGGIGDRFARAVTVDTGRGSNVGENPNSVVMVSGHTISSIGNDAAGTSVWMDLDGQLGLIDSPSTLFTGTSGSGVELPDGFNDVYVGLIPSEIATKDGYGDPLTTMALDMRNILDPSDTTYVYFDHANNYRELRVRYPSLPNSVALISYRVVVGYQSSSDLAGLSLLGIVNPTPPAIEPDDLVLNLPAATSPTIAISAVVSYLGLVSPAPESFITSLKFTAGAGTAKIYFMGLICKVTPQRSTVQSERVITSKIAPISDRFQSIGGSWNTNMRPFNRPVVLPSVTELKGEFYCNIKGWSDDGAGTHTGTASALIERAPDVVSHLLTNYGGVALANLERGASTLGSFVAARTHLSLPDNATSYAMTHAISIMESVDVLTACLWFTADSLSQLVLSPYDNRFRFHVWRTDPSVDYTWKFSRYDLNNRMGPEVEQTPLSDVVTGIRVAYAHDGRQQSQRSEVALTSTRSVAGYDYWGLRDQNMTVVLNTNDYLDFTSNLVDAGAFTVRQAVLTAGVYVPQSDKAPSTGLDHVEGFAQHLKRRMMFAEGLEVSPGVGRYQVTHGTQVTLEYNDYLTFDKAGATIYATIPAGTYATCEALATACQTAANTALGSSIFNCTYDRSTNKFGIWATSSSPVIKIKSGSDYTAAMMQRSCWATLGYAHGGGDVTIPVGAGNKLVAHDIRIEDHFAITNLGNGVGGKFQFSLLFQSGVYGANSPTAVKNCSDLLGFRSSEDKTYTYSSNGGRSYVGDCPKNDREHEMTAAVALYGARRELNVEARTIHETRTALALRNRIHDLFRAPRTAIRFSTRKAPDIERGNVIEFGADLDAIASYPGPGSNGSWVGKRFMVVEVSHDLGPSSLDTDITAIDVGAFANITVAIGIGVMMGGVLMRLAS